MFRSSCAALALATVVASGVLALPGSAQADPATGVTCALGSYALSFDKPVTATPQDIQAAVSYRFTNCISVTDPALTSGAVNYTIERTNFTCTTTAVDSFTTDYAIHWNTGETSDVSVTGVSAAETTLVTGTVSAGLFARQTVTIAVQGLDVLAPTNCLTSGISSLSGIATLDLT